MTHYHYIHNIRSDIPVTRDSLNKITMAILDGPAATREDRASRYNAAIAYLLIRHTLSDRECHSYLQKHQLPTSTMDNLKKDMREGRITLENGRLIRHPPERKKPVTLFRRVFCSIIDEIEVRIDSTGVIHPETAQRMMYVKHLNEDLKGNAVHK